MGVHGLWQLISSTGKPVPLESLEGKILAVDVSVWLHQLSKGMRDSSGNPVPYAHLHGLFTRICKLLYYRIKPVFVFDGGVPALKKQTLASRRSKREDAEQTSTLMQQKILTNLIRSQALKEALGDKSLPKLPPLSKSSARGNKDAIFQLPPLPDGAERYLSQHKEMEDKFEARRELQHLVEEEFDDLDEIDVESPDFLALPPDIQHEIITDMKERRKNRNMSKLADMPEDSKEFSSFQMAKLLKHSKLSLRLVEVRKELNERQTRNLSKHYSDKYYGANVHSQRVVSEDSSHYILIKGLKNRKKKEEEERKEQFEMERELPIVSEDSSSADELLMASDNEELKTMNFMEVNQGTIMERVAIGQSKSYDLTGQQKTNKISVNGQSKSRVSSTMKDDKPRYRPVIEIDSDSDSSDEENNVESIDEFNETEILNQYGHSTSAMFSEDADVVMADLQSNRDLQLAIEQSLKEQKVTAMKTDAREKINKLNEEPAKHIKLSQNNESAVHTKQALTSKLKSKSLNLDNDTEKSVRANKELKDGDLEKNANLASKIIQSSSIFKRQISCLSNNSEGSASKKMKRLEESYYSKVEPKNTGEEEESASKLVEGTESDETETSESEDEFIEVKIDTENVAEDSMFPASMFEAADTVGDSKLSDFEDGDHSDVDESNHSDVDESNHSDVEDKSPEPALIAKEPELQENRTSSDSESESETEQDVEGIMGSDDDVISVASKSDDVTDIAMETIVSPPVERDNMPDIIEDTYRRPDNPRVPDLVTAFRSLDEKSVRGMRDNLAQETKQLQMERGRQERLAMSITDQMHSEAQELLQLFGIPYIVSPTEAEAQCAQLDLHNLTHGTITDDSDIWLFGGKCVYKNFFNQQKHVECFKDVNITSKLGLMRESLINIALLCGSDYTEGIQGVGPVTAMEILAEFPGKGLEGLVKLKSWWEETQKQLRVPVAESKLRAKLRQLDIRPVFPSQAVVEAYLCPMVDESTDKFTWSLPDLDQLRQFASDKLGWTRDKTDENLLPVMKNLDQKQTQRKISSFFQPEVYIQPAKMKSKRLQKAVTQFLYPQETNVESEEPVVTKKTKRGSNALVPERTLRGRKVKGQDKCEGQSKVDEENKLNTAEKNIELIENVEDSGKSQRKGRGKKCQITSKYFDTQKRSEFKVTDISTTSDSESDSASSNSSDSSFEPKRVTSDDETPVIETGLNIADILNMKMGGLPDGMITETSPKASNMLRVFENGLNVTELMNLDGDSKAETIAGNFEDEDDDFEEVINEAAAAEVVQVIDSEEDEIKDNCDENDRKIDLFENEGGFVREDDSSNDIEMMESRPVMEEGDTFLIDKFGDSAKTRQHKGGGMNVSEDKLKQTCREPVQNTRGNKRKNDALDLDSVSTEDKVHPKRLTVSKDSKFKEMLNIDSEISQGDCLHSNQHKEGLPNSNTSCLTTDKNIIDMLKKNSSEKDQKSDKTENNELVKASVEPIKTEKSISKKPTKIEVTHSFTNEPIKQTVTGVPWADKRKRKGKGGKAKGPAKGSLRMITPVEQYQKKATVKKHIKNPVGCVNLSESDSDS